MPGIAGIISRHKSPDECRRLVARMTRSMFHEKFYTSGIQTFDALGVYAGWVAHADSLAAGQTFWNERRDVALVFAGECFSDLAMRSELERKGHDLGTAAGGWLVHLYEELGDTFFETLNGLFSGLLVDLRSKCAFLFNDRFGIERLYWHETSDATYFASEAKALLRVLPQLRQFDEAGVAQFMSFGCVLDWRTLFRGMELAPGGTLWTIENGLCRRARYFTPEKWEAQAPLDEDAFEEELAGRFERVLPPYFEFSGRAGIALTGGLDTRMIMACLPQTASKSICYTYAGVTGETRDARVAARVAAACGLEHGLLRIGEDFFSNFGDWMDRTVYVTDGSFGAMGTHEVYLNALARALSPLRVTGVFGSEILRGVSTFKAVPFSQNLVQSSAIRAMLLEARSEAARQVHPVTSAAFREIPWNIQPSLVACRSQVVFRTPFLDNAIVALAYRAPVTLRRSQRAAVRFVERHNPGLAAIPTDRGYLGSRTPLAGLLRRTTAEVTFKLDYYNNEGMPQALTRFEPCIQSLNRVVPIFGQHKYLHYRRWFRRELADSLRASAAETASGGSGIWNASEVRRMAEEHISGARNRIHDIGAVLTLRAVERCLLHPQECVTSGEIQL